MKESDPSSAESKKEISTSDNFSIKMKYSDHRNPGIQKVRLIMSYYLNLRQNTMGA